MLLSAVSWIGILLTTSKLSVHASAEFPKYIGAVVQYHAVTDDGNDALLTVKANLKNYRTIIKKASTYKVDIIVFPESSLTKLPRSAEFGIPVTAREYRAHYRVTASYIPHPNDTVNLCDSKDPKYARSISCLAREYRMYIVVNHQERADCPRANCSEDNFLLYNTNVVFDRSGKVVARYRKYHLFYEYGQDAPASPDYSIFRTDFGVTFGQFICFDLVHEEPAHLYARNPEVTDVVFTTYWYDEAPFHYATQMQAAWARAAHVNLLASCYSNAATSSGGSGIYAGRSGPIRVYRKGDTSNALIIAEIPKSSGRSRGNRVRTANLTVHVLDGAEMPAVPKEWLMPIGNGSIIFDDLTPYASKLLEPSTGFRATTLCDRGLCCDFRVRMTYDSKLAGEPDAKLYRHRLVVFNGVRKFNIGSMGGLEVCAMVSCTGDSLRDCGSFYPPRSKVVFPMRLDSLRITRHANLTKRSLYMPTTLTREYLPASDSDVVYSTSRSSGSSLLRMYLVRPRSDLLTFGILARRFERDGEEATLAILADGKKGD